jgi:hypothetical protein
MVVILPQTPSDNVLVRGLGSAGFFTGYVTAKMAVQVRTSALLFSFFLSYLLF